MKKWIAACVLALALVSPCYAGMKLLLGVGNPPVAASGAVTIDATGTEKHVIATGTTFSDNTVITVGTGNALVATIVLGYAVTPPTSVACTWDGTSMVNLSSADEATGFASVYLFGLRSPATGAKTLACGWTNTSEIFVDAISFNGVNVTSDATAFPVAGRVTQQKGIGQTVAVTSAINHYVVGTVSPGSSSGGMTGTTLFFDTSSGSFINAGANYDVGAATVNIGTAGGSTGVIIGAVDVAF